MASNIDRWEKDPFFPAAEEVQDSADRMESAYRIWIHESKDASSICNQNELLRDVHTALGTAKWQLEEFERAVKSSYADNSAEDAKTRHHQFIAALDTQVMTIENSINEASVTEGKTTLPWVDLDQGERDELALFLLGSSGDGDEIPTNVSSKNEKEGNLKRITEEIKSQSKQMNEEAFPDCSSNSFQSVEMGSIETREERPYGHRRTASASASTTADIDTSWKVGAEEESFQRSSLNGRRPDQPPPRILSFSGLLSTAESMPKLQWSKNGFRKWKLQDINKAADAVPLQPQQPGQGVDTCYGRNKSSLDSCDSSYDKRLYGWLGAFQRQLRRSQYQLQYSRPVQVVFSAVLVLCLIVLFALHAI